MKKLILLLAPVIVLSITSCRFIGGKRVHGNGNLQTDNRTVAGFSGVDSYGSFDVFVSSGSQNALRIEAEENLLPLIETYVDGDILKIKTKEGFWLDARRGIKVYITAPSYSRIHSYGSGNINGESKITGTQKLDLGITGSADIKIDVDAPEVEAGINGSGNLIISGATKKFDGEISGSGDIRAQDLQTEEAKVHILGSGNANIFASVRLDVNIAGSGDVRYKGSAQVNSNIAGSGSVKKVD